VRRIVKLRGISGTGSQLPLVTPATLRGLREPELQIRTIANSTPPTRDASAVPSTESRRISDDVAQARHTAMSALTNDRFRVMLEQITDPRSSGSLMAMGGDKSSNVTDFASAQSRYAENSE
jgi:hypothetical protein